MAQKLKSVKDIEIKDRMSLDELVKSFYDSGGFTAKNVGIGVNILEKMFTEPDIFNFLSFPACILATGTRGVIIELVKRKLVHGIITTSGALDHDLARSWADYYHGTFFADDAELHQEGINRLGNVFVPNESYGIPLEEHMQPILREIYDSGVRDISTKELAWEFGKRMDERSFLYWAWKNEIPVFIPGITDGAFGSQLWSFWQDHSDFRINVFKDEQDLADIVFTAKKTGALMVGGGISKHHTIWWNQFRDGLDYAVYITTAVEYDGSLSGARVREAVSWGKVREDADYVTVDGDATVLLPLMIGAVIERIRK